MPETMGFGRLAGVAAIVGAVAGAFAFAGGWLSPSAVTPSRLIDVFEKANGSHPGFRRNHAKGVGVSGWFDSNGRGAALSHASVFKEGRVPVIGRIALAGGQPMAADAPHNARSMALLFTQSNGEEWRTGMNDIPVFAVATPLAFRDLLVASAPGADGKPDAAKMGAFFAQYPESARALAIIKAHPPSSGFANDTYNSLDAFRFVDDHGVSTPVRWAMEPVDPVAPVDESHGGDADKNRLFDALIARMHERPIQWHLVVTKGEPGDPTNDATVAWPAERTRIDVGTLTLDHIESEDTSEARDINFDPLILPDGISPSDDPILSARSAAYAQSFRRREGEPKGPSAVPAAEVAK